ncbi:ComEC/Rec2 family competence protein [Streptomyces fructofermentans]|nr:ComEC/Rec2 family competence protein [Streptomyces fructofermentans]
MHAAAGSPLGASHPRQEGPADLRLVPPALVAWAVAAWALAAPAEWVVAVTTGCVVVAGGLLAAGRRGTAAGADPDAAPATTASARPVTMPSGPATTMSAGPVTMPSEPATTTLGSTPTTSGSTPTTSGLAAGRRGGRRAWPPRMWWWHGWPRGAVAAALLCAAAAAASAGLHGADLRRGPVPELARRYEVVTAEAEVTSDPRLTRPRISGARAAPPAVLVDAEVRRVDKPDGTTEVTRTPVLLIVDASGWAARERAASPWLSLLPTTRLRVTARVVPALGGGERVAAVLRVRGSGPPRVVGRPSGTQRFAGELRAGLRAATDGLEPDARALLPGLVVGDTSRITPELDEAFKATDLTHLLAVSGANLTILMALLIGPPGRAQRIERRGLAPGLGIPLRATAVCGGVLTLGFVIVCRPDPSVLRAAACGAVALLAIATGRRRSLIPALATAVLVLVLYDPWLARSYGFLLSVVATGALLTLAPRWSAALRRRGMAPRVAEALAAAAAAQVVCAPVVAVLSARVSLVAVPCNLLVEFAVAPATVLGFAALGTAPWAMPVAEALSWCAGWPAGWIADIARAGSALPGAGVDWPGSWTGALLLACTTVVLLLVGRRLLGHPWLVGACAVLLLLVLVQPPPLTRVITGWPPPGWRYAMCDVGQGDATVLHAGDGAGVVVDAGPDPVLVDRCLRTLGITRIPLVVLTHFHADHVAGLPGVLRGRSVGAIETTGLQEPVEQAEFVRRQAAARRIPVTRAVAGERRRVGALDWQVLWPPPVVPGTGGPNDASVVLLVRSAGPTLLMLGDLEPPAQRALLESPAGAAVRSVDVLKVAHHGSAYQDPDLMRRVAPRLAVVSAGADNPYGHPAPATVAALRAGGAEVLRTDRGGAVAVAGGGDRLLVARD